MKKNLVQKIGNTVKVILLVVIVFGVGKSLAHAQFFSSPYRLSSSSILQNANGTWNVGYRVPKNTVADHFSLKIGSHPIVTNAQGAYNGILFRVPEDFLIAGSTETLTLADETVHSTRATDVITVPAGLSPQYVLQSSAIKKDAISKKWRIPYSVPVGTIASDFVLAVGTKGDITGGVIIDNTLVFQVPDTLFSGTETNILVLKNNKTGKLYDANGWVTQGVAATPEDPGYVPGPPPEKIMLDTAATQKNNDGTWSIAYKIPLNTITSNFVLVIGTQGEFSNGRIITNDLVFTVPGKSYSPSAASTLILKDTTNGKQYDINGNVTQGVIPVAAEDNSRYIGGLLVTFPKDGQNIKQTSAVIKVSFHALIDQPYVDTSYVWSKSGDPATNVEKSLLKLPAPPIFKAGSDATGTINLTGLTAGKTYSFVLKNNLTNTVSEPIQFTTPTTADGKSYLSYTGGLETYTGGEGYDAPSTAPAVVDDISDKGIVPRCGRTPGDNVPESETHPCGYKDFLQLIANLLKYALIIFAPIAAILILYSGFMIIILGKIPDPSIEQQNSLRQAKRQIVLIAIGIVIILSAWVIIATITRELGVKESYSLLDLFSGN